MTCRGQIRIYGASKSGSTRASRRLWLLRSRASMPPGTRTRDGEWFNRFLLVSTDARSESLLRFSREGIPALSTCSAGMDKGIVRGVRTVASKYLDRGQHHFVSCLVVRPNCLHPRAPRGLPGARVATSATAFSRSLSNTGSQTRGRGRPSVEERQRRESLMSFGPDLDLAARREDSISTSDVRAGQAPGKDSVQVSPDRRKLVESRLGDAFAVISVRGRFWPAG